MQAFADVPVNCCACERAFVSASSLLQHFAEHVKITVAKDNYDKLRLLNKSYKIRLLNNNNEDIIRDRNVSDAQGAKRSVSPIAVTSRSDSSSHSLSSESSYKDVDDGNERVTCGGLHETQTKELVGLNTKESKQFSVEFDSEKMVINIERFQDDIVEGNNEIDVNESEKSDEISLKRKLSNRKQPTPKKIERLSNGLVKIAPKPDGMQPASYEAKPKKKYNCHLCVKSFGWSTDLKRHILVHTGERPFKCGKCDARFTRNFLLQKHTNKLHPSNKEVLEKNKQLEERVNENLKQLKTKLNALNSEVSNVECKDEEMIFESKIDIKEETSDPLSFNEPETERYVNGNWVLSNNNVEDKLIKSENVETVLVGGT